MAGPRNSFDILNSARSPLSSVIHWSTKSSIDPGFASNFGVTPEDARRITTLISDVAIFVIPPRTLRICRDPDDDVIFETTMVGSADALVSRDEDVIRARDVADLLAEIGIEALTVERFLQRIAPT
jgi:uncharacterized protein